MGTGITSSSRHRLAAGLVALGLLGLAACGDDSGLSADAGDDSTVAVGTAPEFDGCGSEGDIVNYRWTIRQTPSNMAEDVGKPLKESSVDCAFTLEAAMVADEIGTWIIELTVTDGDGATSSDSVQIEVTG